MGAVADRSDATHRGALVRNGRSSAPRSRRAATLPHEDNLEAVSGTAHRAAAPGIATRLRTSTLRPITALLEVAADEDAALVVLGRDLERLGNLRFRRAAGCVRERSPCRPGSSPRTEPGRRAAI
jgi:nucleotide-binding universal stress UspA family protein